MMKQTKTSSVRDDDSAGAPSDVSVGEREPAAAGRLFTFAVVNNKY